MLSDLYLSSASDKPLLRIGLLLDSPVLSAAFAQVVSDIQRCNFARLELLVYNASHRLEAQPARHSRYRTLWRMLRNRNQRDRLAWTLYSKLDQRFSRVSEDPLAEVDCSAALAGVEALHVSPIAKGFVHRFPPEAIETIRSHRLDVLVRFGFNIIRGDILTAPQFGVWSFHHGDNDFYRGGPAHFWEMVEHNPLSGVILQILTDELDAGGVLIKGLFATESTLSLKRNRVQPYWASTHFVIQKLWELHTYGWEYVKTRMLPPSPYLGKRKIYRSPGNRDVIRWAVPEVLTKTTAKARRTLLPQDQIKHWRIAIRAASRHSICSGDLEMRSFRWVESPPDHFYADPFLVEHDGSYWIFFEDYTYSQQRGVISCAELSHDGTLTTPRLALDTGKHASYPYLFSQNGSLYMIPETMEHDAVLLYRCVRFPDQWKLEAELFRGRIVDTSVCQKDGLWWFFVTFMEPRGHGMAHYLFFSESLTGKWQYHPANPISLDVRSARSAGAIRTCRNKLIRPTQDSSIRYGYAMNFAEVLELTPTRYEERRILTLLPSWEPGLLATHTYNCSGPFEVIDGLSVQRRSAVLAT